MLDTKLMAALFPDVYKAAGNGDISETLKTQTKQAAPVKEKVIESGKDDKPFFLRGEKHYFTPEPPQKAEQFINLDQKEIEPVKEKEREQGTSEAKPSPNIFSLQAEKKDLRPCGIGDFIGVLCSSFNAGLYEEQYAPYPQVWFTDEEAADKCIGRGYQMTAKQARKFLGQILERGFKCGYKLMESRENITIGRREYRRANLSHSCAKKNFGVEAPSFKCERPPTQE